MTRSPTLAPRRCLPAALALVAAALWNPWSWDWLLGSGSLEHGPARLGLLALGAGLVLWAVRTLRREPTRAGMRVHVLLFTTFLLLPLALELALRFELSSPDSKLRNPGLYSDPYGEDDYWKLVHTWRPTQMQHAAGGLDPLLGWTRPPRPGDPLGIHRPLGYEPRTKDVILCFGDSFMSSKPDEPNKIPTVVERLVPGRVAYNFGGGGYGVGQIYLRFREHHLAFEDPIVVVGIMDYDLDRTILSVRSAPKPRFRLQEGELTLEQPGLVPGSASSLEQWYVEHPVELRSYLAGWLVNLPRRRQGPAWMPNGRDEKERLNRALIERLIAEAREHERRLLFITFPAFGMQSGWRRELLAEVLDAQAVPWVDGAAELRRSARDEGVEIATYFRADNHPNGHGNELLGAAVAARVLELWGEGPGN